MKTWLKKIIGVLAHLTRHKNRQFPASPRQIAVIACHWLGDTFWASQTIPHLRQRFPDAAIHLFLRRDFSDLFYGMVPTENIHLAPEVISDRRREPCSWQKLAAAARRFRPLNFDLAIDLTGNRYSALFTRWLHPGYSIGFEGDELGALYSFLTPRSAYADLHLCCRPLQVMQAAIPGLTASGQPLPPRLKCSFEQACAAVGLTPARPLAIIAPCAGWAEKEWGDQKFAVLAAELASGGWQVVVSGTQQEAARVAAVAGHCAVAWNGELATLCALLAGAKLFVGNDSGVGHLAAAFNVPRVIIIFTGNTEPGKLAPSGAQVTVLDGRNIAVAEVLSRCR